jgi:Flp pilus assembly protein TadD
MASAGQRSSSFSSTLVDVFGFDASERRANVRSCGAGMLRSLSRSSAQHNRPSSRAEPGRASGPALRSLARIRLAPTAWVGLAVAYDRIGRFDLADRTYAYAIRLVGETTEILNNQGYSYMLRGDLVNARKKFLKAYAREPNNPTIANNLQLLNSSYRFIQRAPAQ